MFKLFSLFLLVLGVLLVYFNFNIESSIAKTCTSDSLRHANKGLLVMGLLLMFLALSVFVCPLTCNTVKQTNLKTSLNVYCVVSMLLAIVIISLGSVISANLDEECIEKDEKTGKNKTTSSPTICIVLGVLLLLISGGTLGTTMYMKSSNPLMNF